MLKSLRYGARMAVVRRTVGVAAADAAESFVEGRLAMLDPVPRMLLRMGECVAAVPELGVQLPGGRQYADVVAGLATAYEMEREEVDP